MIGMGNSTFIAPRASVLVVDDNALNLKVATGYLKPYQVQTETAKSGMEAIDMIRQKKYDLVFMDHMMPDMDGIETHREIRLLEKDYVAKLPVVALTANAVGEISEMFMKEGFQDFMTKPIQSERLKEVLRRWLPKELIINKEEYDE